MNLENIRMALRFVNKVHGGLVNSPLVYKRKFGFSASTFQKNVVPVTTNEVDMRTEKEKLIEKKFLELMQWYEKFTGLNEVRVYQNRVIKAQDELIRIQEQRRHLNENLSRIVLKRNELQARFHTISRDDPQWYSIIGQENKLLLEEKQLRSQMTNIERDERDFFTYMCNAVRDSHEKQRWQSDRTKYWSLVLTIISSFLTYLVSDWRHKRIIQQLIDSTNTNHHENDNSSIKNIYGRAPPMTEINKSLKSLEETVAMKNTAYVTSHVNEMKQLQGKITTCIANEKDINENLIKLQTTLAYNHKEALKLISNNKQIQFVGAGNETFDDISGIHGPSFGLGILCTIGVLALIGMVLSSGSR